jgi:hypothetical protein
MAWVPPAVAFPQGTAKQGGVTLEGITTSISAVLVFGLSLIALASGFSLP